MRILLTTQGYPPTISGVTLLVQRLAHAMTERGHEVIVLAGSDRMHPYEENDRGARVIRLRSHHNPYWPANPIPSPSREDLGELIARLRPDVIHTHDALPFCVPLARERAELGRPLLATCHYLPGFISAYLTRERIPARAVDSLAWRGSVALYNRVDVGVFPTAMQRDRFREWGVSAPTRVISNGVDLERYTPRPEPSDCIWSGRLPEGRRILAVGRLALDKHLDVLIRSMAALRATFPVHLLLAGEGPYRTEIEKRARGAHVEDLVHFLGFVPENDLPALYRSCDVFAISSAFEVQSIPALQAAACGRPIVAASAGSLPEICHDGENGVLVHSEEPEEYAVAIRRALSPDANVRMREASRVISLRHDERRTFDEYEALYYHAVSCARRSCLAGTVSGGGRDTGY